MVGDVKQSIYRFRQAKPELFLDKYNKYPLEEGSLNRKIQLYKNFRSREEVISGVNYIFKEVMSKTVGELEYTDDEALNLGASYKENEDENSKELIEYACPIRGHLGFNFLRWLEEFLLGNKEIEDTELYHVLSMRYVSKNTFEEISNNTNWSLRKIFSLHGKALQEFERRFGNEYLESVH